MLTQRTPKAWAAALRDFATFRSGGQFTPLTVGQQTVVFPGFDGGAEWGGPCVDRKRGILYINSNDIAWTGGLAEPTSLVAVGQGAKLYQEQCSVCHGLERQGVPAEFPRLIDIGSRRWTGKLHA
jgi:quinoprotein glucose dehydrogenase